MAQTKLLIFLCALVVAVQATQLVSFELDRHTLDSPTDTTVRVNLNFASGFVARNVTIVGHTRCSSVTALDRSCQQQTSLRFSHQSPEGLPVWTGELKYGPYDSDGFCHGHLLVTSDDGQERWFAADAFDTDFGVYLQRGISPPPRPQVLTLSAATALDSSSSNNVAARQYEIRAEIQSAVPVRLVQPVYFSACGLPLDAFQLISGNHTSGVWVLRVPMDSDADTQQQLCVLAGVAIRDEFERVTQHLQQPMMLLLSSNATAAPVLDLQIQQTNRHHSVPKFRVHVQFAAALPQAAVAVVVSECTSRPLVWQLSRSAEFANSFSGVFSVSSFSSATTECSIALQLSDSGAYARVKTAEISSARLRQMGRIGSFAPHFQNVLPSLTRVEISPPQLDAAATGSSRSFTISATYLGRGDPFSPDSADAPTDNFLQQSVRVHMSPADFQLAGSNASGSSSVLLLSPVHSTLNHVYSPSSSAVNGSTEWNQTWQGAFEFLPQSTSVLASIEKICFPYEFSCVSGSALQQFNHTSVTYTAGKAATAPSLSGDFDAMRCLDYVLIGFAIRDETASSCDDALKVIASFSEVCEITREVRLECVRDNSNAPWFHFLGNASSRSITDRVEVIGWREITSAAASTSSARVAVFNRTFVLPQQLDKRCATFTAPPRTTFVLDTYPVAHSPSSSATFRFDSLKSVLLAILLLVGFFAAITALIYSYRRQRTAEAENDEKQFQL